MPLSVSVAVLVAIALLGLWAMWHGWRARARRTAVLVPSVPDVPATPRAPRTDDVEAVYVSSTRAGDWLDRVVAHDLGIRSPARVRVHADGVHVARTGARDVWVPAGALRAVGTTSGQAGKFVGRDELVVLTWVPDPGAGTAIDTALQVRHDDARAALLAAVRALLAAPTDTDTTPPAAQEEQA
ncbi:PH-like domain-containing protein [Cellulomonas xiejunii]|uniref:PH domain-containing protein n=1 Tax=Cellulomonas xiejunii TaxID=2968083 RepID=A0ABY5KV51_9CELL|nr:hypothetical protein [Cellulomonas xiejunii]MCC2314833.1 hypothetical protein [Cellulomonas xiejunii]MCC2323115.1 hypothetical protein [Cellulomonas xiejunii]UUI73605.1 hypothetical protein NP048_09340 [Cellulomonas xiejunii]